MTQDLGPCNSYVEVDMAGIKENIKKIRSGLVPGTEIIAVLKGNAYGMGLTEIGKFLVGQCGVNTLACAHTWEAIQFREAGIDKDILVMGGVPFNNIGSVVAHDIHTPAYSREYLKLLNAQAGESGKTAKVHIKIETGLNRIGVLPGADLEDFCEFLKTLGNIKPVGIYTHFAESEIADKSFTLAQMEKFKGALGQVRAHGFELSYIHACNTAAATWLLDGEMTHIRPAGLLFGFDPNIEPANKFALKEVISWKAFVTNVKTVALGETVGYNRVYKADKETKVATVSAGYGDGYPRHLAASMKAEMLVNGRRARVIGICMDQLFLDVTGIDVKLNDEVTLIGKDGEDYISVFELQEKMGQIYLAAIATISGRVKRTYKY